MPDERTPSRIADEHDALRERATPGPWETNDPGVVLFPDGGGWVAESGTTEDPTGADAAYITALANDDAAMCAAVRALEAEVARLQAVLDRIECPNCGSMACTNPTTGEIDGWMIPVPPVPDEAPQ